MLLNKKQLFFRDLFRSRKMLSWLKKICWILFFLLCMIKLYAQSEVIPGLFTTYQQNGRILWVIPDSLLGRDMSLPTTILEGAGRKKKSADAKFGYQGDRFGPRILRWDIGNIHRNGGEEKLRPGRYGRQWPAQAFPGVFHPHP